MLRNNRAVSIMRICICSCLGILILTANFFAEPQIPSGNAATSATSSATTCEDSGNLSNFENDKLVQCRDTLQKEIADLNTRLGYLRDVRGYLAMLMIAKAKGDRTRQQTLETKIYETEPWAGLMQGEGQKSDKVEQAITENERKLAGKQRSLSGVDSQISRRLNKETSAQDFKKLMSAFFAIIVALVIIGFFITAWIDENVRQEIFAGQVGIQFVTLFSLVIAIILFGITGVLEGKELAALLGGLAGYILGRTGSSATPNPAASATTPVPAKSAAPSSSSAAPTV